MPFGRAGKGQSNRSQHSLIDPGPAHSPGSAGGGGGGGAPASAPAPAVAPAVATAPQAPISSQQQHNFQGPPSASSPTTFSTGEATQNTSNNSSSNNITATSTINSSNSNNNNGNNIQNRHPSNTPIQTFVDLRQQQQLQKNQEFDQVGRSQSHRFPQQVSAHPAAYGIASSSFDDLPTTALHISSPLLQQALQQNLTAPAQQQHQQAPPPEARRSTRKLIKNILGGNRAAEQQQQQQQQQQSHLHQEQPIESSSSHIFRRSSHRVSQAPPIRTGVSQVSLELPPVDWQSQGPPQTQAQAQPQPQPSPLQGVGEFRDLRLPADHSNQELLQQTAQEPLHTTIRHIQTDLGPSPYGRGGDSVGAYQQLQLQGQVLVPAQRTTPDQQHSYGHIQFDHSPQQQQQQFQFQHSPQPGQYHHQQGLPPVFTGHLGPNSQHFNPETISQLSHDSPVTDPDQTSANPHSTQTSPAVKFPTQSQELQQSASLPLIQAQTQGQPQVQGFDARQQQHQQEQLPPPPQQRQEQEPQEDETMKPPQGGPPSNRRSQENDKNMRGQMDPPPGPPPGYRHSQGTSNNPMQQGNPGGLNQNYRQSTVQDRQYDGAGVDGRNSPQPTPAGEAAEPDKAFRDLLAKYKNVKRLYFDGKNQIEQLNGQVEQLQNALANQRISQSRTSLDDNEYTTRFNRLNGAINNLSFNIRKDWVIIPPLLDGYVSPDALRTGKQEMTAVGRAAITAWVLDFVFDRCFHPGLDPTLSHSLKQIEKNIRNFSYTMNSQEEYEALTYKVVSWRMATLEGLRPQLDSAQSVEHRAAFTAAAAQALTSKLFDHLANPPPAGVDGSVSMIVELAVGIASSLPMESRDVAITYPSPGSVMQPNIMEVEKTTGLPPLETRPPDNVTDGDSEEEERSGGKDGGGREAKSGSKNNARGDKTGKSAAATSSSTANPPLKDLNKIRFAGFVAVEVRGRQVLVKAPVWTLT